jgi:hypothetical protein
MELTAVSFASLTKQSNFETFSQSNPKFLNCHQSVPSMPSLSHARLSQNLANLGYEDKPDKVGINHNANAIFWEYLSDLSFDNEDIDWVDDTPDIDAASKPVNYPLSTQNFIPPPRPKRRKLDIPVHTS